MFICMKKTFGLQLEKRSEKEGEQWLAVEATYLKKNFFFRVL